MQILELLFLINGLKKCKWTSLCTWYVIFALFTHIFYISKTDKILPFFSQFSSKFLQHFWGNRFTCMFLNYVTTMLRTLYAWRGSYHDLNHNPASTNPLWNHRIIRISKFCFLMKALVFLLVFGFTGSNEGIRISTIYRHPGSCHIIHFLHCSGDEEPHVWRNRPVHRLGEGPQIGKEIAARSRWRRDAENDVKIIKLGL